MFTAGPPECPPTEEQAKKTRVFIQWKLSCEKRNLVITPACMDLEGIVLSEISQRKTNTASFRVYVEPKNSGPGTLTDTESTWSFQKGEGEGRVKEVREVQGTGLHAVSLGRAAEGTSAAAPWGRVVAQGTLASCHHESLWCLPVPYVSRTSVRKTRNERGSGKTVE